MPKRDLLGGLALIAFAGFYALAASSLSMTSSLGIGSGLFPMMLAGILALLGILITVQAAWKTPSHTAEIEEELASEAGPVPLRGVILVVVAPIIFAVLVVPLGVGPALGIAVFVSALANRTTSFIAAAGVAVVMVLFCLAIFRWALDLPLRMLGPWLTG